jgi:hypothetical protein
MIGTQNSGTVICTQRDEFCRLFQWLCASATSLLDLNRAMMIEAIRRLMLSDLKATEDSAVLEHPGFSPTVSSTLENDVAANMFQ